MGMQFISIMYDVILAGFTCKQLSFVAGYTCNDCQFHV